MRSLSDEDLVARYLADPERERRCLEVLCERYYQKVARWCLRVCGSHQEAADLAQEVFLRVQQRLHLFRGESRFSTWLYTVTRHLAINRGVAERRRAAAPLEPHHAERPDTGESALQAAQRRQLGALARRAMREELDPLEGQVFTLHYLHGLTLESITRLLGLANRSGAKAHLVRGQRKLKKYFAGDRRGAAD